MSVKEPTLTFRAREQLVQLHAFARINSLGNLKLEDVYVVSIPCLSMTSATTAVSSPTLPLPNPVLLEPAAVSMILPLIPSYLFVVALIPMLSLGSNDASSAVTPLLMDLIELTPRLVIAQLLKIWSGILKPKPASVSLDSI